MVYLTASSTQRLTRIGGTMLDMNADYTVCGWLDYDGGSGSERGIVIIRSGANADGEGDLLRIESGSLGVIGVEAGGGVALNTGSALSTGTLYHVALVRSGDMISGYLNGVLDCSQTVLKAGRTASGGMVWGATQADGNAPITAGFRGWKAWQRALTAAELRREMRTTLPCSHVSLFEAWPFMPGSARANGYFRGRNVTEVNSPTDSDPVPIAWRRRSAVLWMGQAAPAGGGGTITASANAISSSGPQAGAAAVAVSATGAATSSPAVAAAAGGPVVGASGAAVSSPTAGASAAAVAVAASATAVSVAQAGTGAAGVQVAATAAHVSTGATVQASTSDARVLSGSAVSTSQGAGAAGVAIGAVGAALSAAEAGGAAGVAVAASAAHVGEGSLQHATIGELRTLAAASVSSGSFVVAMATVTDAPAAPQQAPTGGPPLSHARDWRRANRSWSPVDRSWRPTARDWRP